MVDFPLIQPQRKSSRELTTGTFRMYNFEVYIKVNGISKDGRNGRTRTRTQENKKNKNKKLKNQKKKQ